MANLTENNTWDEVRQLETDDPVLGGEGNISNRQAQNNLNRTTRIKNTLLLAGVDVINGTVYAPTTAQASAVKRALGSEITARTDIANFVSPDQVPRPATDLEVTNRDDVGVEVFVQPDQVPTSVENATMWDNSTKYVSISDPVGGVDGDIWFKYLD